MDLPDNEHLGKKQGKRVSVENNKKKVQGKVARTAHPLCSSFLLSLLSFFAIPPPFSSHLSHSISAPLVLFIFFLLSHLSRDERDERERDGRETRERERDEREMRERKMGER